MCDSISAVFRPEDSFHIERSRVRKGGELAMIQIRLKKTESVERALKRLKKIMDKEGLMKQLRDGRYYEKPCEKARRKAARARIRNRSRNSSAF